jgi:hypothetical protein
VQGKNPDKDKVAALRAGMEERTFTSSQLTNYRRDGKPFQNLLCIIPFLDAYDNLLKFIGEELLCPGSWGCQMHARLQHRHWTCQQADQDM